MQTFEYAYPSTLQEALALLGSQWGEADILAGGTDQISLMKDGIHTPKRVVNIKGVQELRGVRPASSGLRLGALATMEDLLDNAQIRTAYPALYAAAQGVRSPQIRNMGTVGGDLCQRPRCWYFRLGLGLLAQDKEGRSLVRDGQNEYHAIFGNQKAAFVSASSLGPPLVALEAKVKLASGRGNREVPVEKFFITPEDPSAREIDLRPDEILTEVIVPGAAGMRSATYEIRQREIMDWPLATASVVLRMKGQTVESARVVLGHVAPVPWVATAAGQALQGKALDEQSATEAARAAVQDATPLSQNAYKVQLARTAVKRALLEAAHGKA